MMDWTYCEQLTAKIEAVLRARGLGHTIPSDGLDSWVAAALPDDDDPESWADAWVDQVAEREQSDSEYQRYLDYIASTD